MSSSHATSRKHMIIRPSNSESEIIKLLCIILPQMTGYIKYFENGGKSMSFIIRDDDVLDKYNQT